MRRIFLCLGLTLALFAQTTSDDVVANWFPVHVGDKWIYSHESRDDIGDAVYRDGRMVGGSLRVATWETEETTTGVWTVPEGTLVGRHSEVKSGIPPPEYWNEPRDRDQAYLIRGNCAYLRWVEWDPTRHQLKQSYHEDLLAGRLAADFCFPLVTGQTWRAEHFGDWRVPPDAWKVAGLEARDQSTSDQGTTFHVISVGPYLGSGMTAEIWFERGVGMVRNEEIHHGTVGDYRTQLIRFEPAQK